MSERSYSKPPTKQLNVVLNKSLIASIAKKKAETLDKLAESIGTADVVGPALLMWFNIDGLGLLEAIKKAKIEKAKVILERVLNDEPMTVTITDKTAIDLIKAIRDAVQE